MELFRYELYKLCRGKLFIGGTVFTAFIICMLFSFKVSEEISTVDGRFYQGYEAVQKNRQITREFEGILTDEKVNRIIEKYGFPRKVEDNYGNFRDSNYLNSFVTEYLSDGYYYSWDDYKIATKTIPMAQTKLGQVQKDTGKDLLFGYVTGWSVFLEILQMGMILGSILIIFGISQVFAWESQCKMLPLIFTTQEGKGKDIHAKMGASLLLMLLVYTGIVCLDFILCGAVYGFGGTDCLAVFLLWGGMTYSYSPIWQMHCLAFTGLELLSCLLGLVFLWAIILWVSARCRSTFHAVSLCGCLWGLPVLIRIFFRGFLWILINGTPIFLVMTNSLIDSLRVWMVPMGFAGAAAAGCAVSGYRKYKAL